MPLLRELGCKVTTVEAQDVLDGRFPTVASPNPENASALAMGIEQADRIGAEIVIATDPDADRMGIAVRDAAGEMKLMTGNQIGSLLAWYRCMTMLELGMISPDNLEHTVMVKTFVTTPLQDAIGESFGIPVVNVLTGFKYIAAKLGKYEAAIPENLRRDYRRMSEDETRALRLKFSRFFVFGGEESYGYLAQDFVRDKDANAAALLVAELAAYASNHGTNLTALLDDLFGKYGVHLEGGKSIVMEGADGAAKIAALAQSYADHPPVEVDGSAVKAVRDFSKGGMVDAEGDPIPAEKMLFVDLEDGRSFAVRPSGTEPKIKYYLFGHGAPGADVQESRKAVQAAEDSLWRAVEADARKRMG